MRAADELGLVSRKSLWGQFWSSHQRFFKYLCIAAKVRCLVELAKKELEAGKVSTTHPWTLSVNVIYNTRNGLEKDRSRKYNTTYVALDGRSAKGLQGLQILTFFYFPFQFWVKLDFRSYSVRTSVNLCFRICVSLAGSHAICQDNNCWLRYSWILQF